MSKIRDEILKQIEDRVTKFSPGFGYSNVGKITKLGDGVVALAGLSEAKMGEVLEFENGIEAVVLNLKKEEVGAIVFGDFKLLREGDIAKSTGRILSVKVTEDFLGRVIDPLGRAIDGKGALSYAKSKEMLVEKIAPGILFREPVTTPLSTGIKAIDTMIPIGRGQRELIIGDRYTGKTALVIDTIINQSKLNKQKTSSKGRSSPKDHQPLAEALGRKRVISIYVAIGQKQGKVAQVVQKLEELDAMDETIVVAANSSDAVALQYIAPYVGCAIAEYFMDKGEDVLIAYDDLTKHAWAYRQISLVLRRPSGREAYPGDIFYLHSRLLERSCKMNKDYGGGSITALPIIETQAQDISAYIPTNVISITDGQIYLESDLFFQGVRPAINPGLSVSRVGGAAQLKAVKQVAGRLRLELASYNELSSFAQFGSDLDAASRAKIDRGVRVVEILKQPQYQPVMVDQLVLLIWLVTRGYLDNVEVGNCNKMASDFIKLALSKYPKLSEAIYSKEGITEVTENKLKKIAEDYMKAN